MAYMVKNPGLLPSKESVKAGDIGKRRKEMSEIIEGTWRSCIEAGDGMGEKITAIDVDRPQDLFLADVIIANPPSMGHIHCAEKLGIPLHIVFTMPWSPTKAFHHPLAAMEYGDVDKPVANYFSFAVMELLTWQGYASILTRSIVWLCRLITDDKQIGRSYQQIPLANSQTGRGKLLYFHSSIACIAPTDNFVTCRSAQCGVSSYYSDFEYLTHIFGLSL
jgi:hypothetical protein